MCVVLVSWLPCTLLLWQWWQGLKMCMAGVCTHSSHGTNMHIAHSMAPLCAAAAAAVMVAVVAGLGSGCSRRGHTAAAAACTQRCHGEGSSLYTVTAKRVNLVLVSRLRALLLLTAAAAAVAVMGLESARSRYTHNGGAAVSAPIRAVATEQAHSTCFVTLGCAAATVAAAVAAETVRA